MFLILNLMKKNRRTYKKDWGDKCVIRLRAQGSGLRAQGSGLRAQGSGRKPEVSPKSEDGSPKP